MGDVVVVVFQNCVLGDFYSTVPPQTFFSQLLLNGAFLPAENDNIIFSSCASDGELDEELQWKWGWGPNSQNGSNIVYIILIHFLFSSVLVDGEGEEEGETIDQMLEGVLLSDEDEEDEEEEFETAVDEEELLSREGAIWR